MPKGYWIARVDIHDIENYKREYMDHNGPVFAKYGAKFLVRSGQHEVAEGNARGRNIILEFPDYATALACFKSPEYKKLIEARQRYGEADILIIEGYAGPQPA
jgi:uncharacterized protein (DUF1330 family)